MFIVILTVPTRLCPRPLLLHSPWCLRKAVQLQGGLLLQLVSRELTNVQMYWDSRPVWKCQLGLPALVCVPSTGPWWAYGTLAPECKAGHAEGEKEEKVLGG